MIYSTADIWLIIAVMGIGTYLIRFSFLGLIGDRPLPPFIERLLRFTPVAVLPGMVAPLVLWPTATGGELDLVRICAAIATLVIGLWRKHVLLAGAAGVATLYAGLFLTGQL